MSGISKVVYGNETLLDISQDTVNENNLLLGATAHGSDGEPIEGAVITHDVIDNLTSTSTEDALSANQGKVLNENKINHTEIADTYLSTKTYVLDDIVYYNGNLWRCLQMCYDEAPSEGQFWTQITVSGEFANVQKDIYLAGTLEAGDSTLFFTHESFTDDACIDIYTEDAELGYIERTFSAFTHTLTITFPPQTSDIRVKVCVKGGV